MSRVKKIALLAMLGVILFIIVGGVYISRSVNFEALADIPIKDINLTKVADGTYKGSYNAFPIWVIVEVTVEHNKITSVDLVRHFNGKGEAAEVIPEKVIKAQSLQVDAVTGASYSSKVILLAIEDALKRALR